MTITYEIERKFLLSKLPPILNNKKYSKIIQGWLPGNKIRERLRHVCTNPSSTKWIPLSSGRFKYNVEKEYDTYYRTIKLGTGISKIEVEEIVPDVKFWYRLWSLTDLYLKKNRYKVKQGKLTWEVDNFNLFRTQSDTRSQTLVIAEIELPSVKHPVILPRWLSPYVVREVTESSEYVNINLAVKR